ncbi:MAG: thiamine pyrophosphate-binding protein [Lentisphaerae bacterium]|nr:thiamine pyrophosphate-binding protein [Lentisphaerota bacterium]
MKEKILASGNEAIAMAAYDCGVSLGCGYPGTPSSEILDEFSKLGGNAEWEPNEKCALETAIGAAATGCRALVTMKHVGLNVAADPLFTIAYSGTPGGLVIITADDPGMASSQNEQDNRRYARAAGVPMFEPTDTQECYDLLKEAFKLADKFRSPVLFRVTTRVCHSKCIMYRSSEREACRTADFVKDPKLNVMIPAYAKLAHKRLRADLNAMAELSEDFAKAEMRSSSLGVITSGISYQHVLDAAPEASILKISFTYPLPEKAIRKFVDSVERCVIVEEGDPILFEGISAMGIKVENKAEEFRFGELSVERARKLIARDTTPDPVPPKGKAPQLCPGCPHRKTYEVLRDLDCIVSGDIGCYTLGVLPPFEALHIGVCMGASITVGLGMRKTLPEEKARKVVSVIGDSTFLHTGVNGIVEMVYNRPATGHVVLILDNSTTAMTGLQEHPGTGKKLDHKTPAKRVIIEDVVRGMGVDNVDIIDTTAETERFAELLKERLASNDCSVIIARRPCILAQARDAKARKAAEGKDK